MKNKPRINFSAAGQRAFALAKQAALFMRPEVQEKVRALHAEVGNYEAVLLNSDEQELLSAVGVMLLGAMLEMVLFPEKQDLDERLPSAAYVAHLVRSVYTSGVLRGRREQNAEAYTTDTRKLDGAFADRLRQMVNDIDTIADDDSGKVVE